MGLFGTIFVFVIFSIVLMSFAIHMDSKGKHTENKEQVDYFPSVSNIANKSVHYNKQNGIFYQFDVNQMTFYRSYEKSGIDIDIYYIPKNYIDKVKNYVITINAILSSFCQKYQSIELHNYKPNDLIFDKNGLSDDFCVFLHHPLTATGKIAKYPYSLSLRFGSSDISDLEVYFDKYGNFLKGEFCCWHNKQCYLLTATVFNKELQITKAKINKLGKKEKIFDIKEN